MYKKFSLSEVFSKKFDYFTKILKSKNKIDLVFLVIFFLFLFIPMSHINQDKISKTENRYLAQLQPLFLENHEINYLFGKNFDNWFNDRFFLRDKFIFVYDNLISLSSNKIYLKNGFYNKKTNWMFANIADWYSINFNSAEFENLVVLNLNLFNEFCKQNNIKLYLMVVPSTNEVYYEQGSPYIIKKLVMQNNATVYSILNKLNFPSIYLFDDLRNASKTQMTYYKTDWHWTDYGAFIGYQSIVKLIQKDFPYLKPLKKEDFNITTSYKIRSDWDRSFHSGETMTSIFPSYVKDSEKILNTKYYYYENKNKNKLMETIIDAPYHKEKLYNYNYCNNLKLLQIGTSMNESLLQFTPYSFHKTKYIRIQNIKEKPDSENYKIIKYYKKEILDYKPDIIILCLTPWNLSGIKDLFKE